MSDHMNREERLLSICWRRLSGWVNSRLGMKLILWVSFLSIVIASVVV